MKTNDNAKKFVLASLPGAEYLSSAVIRVVRVGYLQTTPESEVKILGYDELNEYFLTQKKKGLSSGREKSREPISKEVFEMLYPLTEGKRVHKKCYIFDQEKFKLRFDDFLDQTTLGKIQMLEVEGLEGEEYAFPKETWTEGIIDVTDDPKYLNQNLAK